MGEFTKIFRFDPPKSFIKKIAAVYGIKELDESYKFPLCNIIKKNVIDGILEYKKEFEYYYFPDTYDKYINNITPERTIVILRQLVKKINYTLIRSKTLIEGKLLYQYNIVNNKRKTNEYRIIRKKIVLSFN